MKSIIDYLKQYGISADTTITLLTTLLTFIVGLFAAWLAGKLKDLKERKSYRKSVKAILLEFQKSCSKQNKIVSDSLEKVGLKKGNDFVASFIPIGTIEYLTKLDLQVFLKNFEPFCLPKLYPRAISKLFDLLAIIKNQNESLAKDLNYFSERFSKNENIYQENINSLRKIVDELQVSFNGKEIEIDKGGQLIQDYFTVFDTWFKNGRKTDMASTYTEIVIPTLELGKKHKSFPLILPIVNHALKCDYAFQNIDKIEAFLIKRYKNFAFAHRRAARLLSPIIKTL